MYDKISKYRSQEPLKRIMQFNGLRRFLQNNVCSWFNYQIIVALRKEYLFKEGMVDERLLQYENLFRQYVRKRCFLYLEDLGPQPQDVATVPVVCKIDGDLYDLTFDLIKHWKLIFVQCLNQVLSMYSVILRRVQEGCIELEFQAPAELKYITTLTTEQVDYLRENQFIEVVIDGCKLLSKVYEFNQLLDSFCLVEVMNNVCAFPLI